MGMYAFGLEETNLFQRAEKMARKALDRNHLDSWATHALAHVFEMEGRQREGIEFLKDTRQNWNTSTALVCHNSWHKSLYHLQLEEYQEVIHIYDDWMRFTKTENIYDLIDCTSLLFQCSLKQVDVGDRWEELMNKWELHIDDHFLTFNDVHIMLNIVGSSKLELADKLLVSMEKYSSENKTRTQSQVLSEVGISLGKAIKLWGQKDFEECVHLITPIRYNIQSIGGSAAQRDIFNSLMIDACVKSKDYSLAESLLSEKLEYRPNQPQTWKTYSQILEQMNRQNGAKIAREKYQALLTSNY